MGRLRGKKPSPAMSLRRWPWCSGPPAPRWPAWAAVSVLNKKEKKQTRNIAKDEIKKAAPALSVANAGTLDRLDSTAFAQSTVTGAADQDYPSIPAGSCLTRVFGAGVDIENDVISVSASEAYTDQGFTLYAADSNQENNFRIIVCNVTNAAIDPPNANFRFIIFRR